MSANFMEQGPDAKKFEHESSGVERLREIRAGLEAAKKEIDSRIDDLVKEIGKIIAKEEEKSLQGGESGDVLQEILESRNIMDEIDQLREAAKRLEVLIGQFGKKVE